MANDAGIGFVDGCCQDGRINKQGFGHAGGIGRRQRFVGMAIQAVAVGKPRPHRHLPEEAERGDEQESRCTGSHGLSIGHGRQHGLTSVGESLSFFVEPKPAREGGSSWLDGETARRKKLISGCNRF
jgi:hypothetical protein